MSDMDVFRRWLDEKSAELTRLRSLVTKVEGERDAARAALAVAEGERLRLAIALREMPKYRTEGTKSVPIDPDWLNAFRAETRLAVRIADGMEEGSENG